MVCIEVKVKVVATLGKQVLWAYFVPGRGSVLHEINGGINDEKKK